MVFASRVYLVGLLDIVHGRSPVDLREDRTLDLHGAGHIARIPVINRLGLALGIRRHCMIAVRRELESG